MSIREVVKPNQAKDYLNLDLESIVSIDEENFFQASAKKINVFRILVDSEELKSNRSVLQKYYFSHTHSAMTEKISKMKIPIYRDISTMSRKLVTDLGTGRENIQDFM